MNAQEKAIARIQFQNKIYRCDGQAFEDLFTEVMNYAVKDFQSIKPWGNIGDRKNDGYIKSEGTFFQVYSPEDIKKSYVESVKKLHRDFNGLIKQWAPVNKFYFVINDKYKGVNADCEQAIQDIQEKHQLADAKILTAKDIENIVFELDDDQIFKIVGYLPDPSNLRDVDYSILNEVISHIMNIPLEKRNKSNLKLPDWDEKIQFNNLSSTIAEYLNNASIHLASLEEYLSHHSNFVADALRDKLNEVYQIEKETRCGDELFMAIVNELSPKMAHIYQETVIIIMAKYFETCDIFEEPIKEEGEE
jgi:hypothetical protein